MDMQATAVCRLIRKRMTFEVLSSFTELRRREKGVGDFLYDFPSNT